MTNDRSNIEAAKRALPLPDLLRRLGFEPPAENEGNMQSPFAKGRRQKSPSFSIFRRGESWGWCDRSGGTESKGDEITLIEKLEGLSRASAIARYLSLAGLANAIPGATVRTDGASGTRATDSKNRTANNLPPRPVPPVNWPEAVKGVTASHKSKLANWRGLSAEFVEWLVSTSSLGICRGAFAFPVHDDAGAVIAAHVRPDNGKWFFWPKGQGMRPLVFGDLSTAERTLLFESQWDALAVMDEMGWHTSPPSDCAVIVTRGASNGRLAAGASGTVYAWPQNDEPKEDGTRPGEVWLQEVAAHAPGEVFRVSVPPAHKDANDWTRAESVDVAACLSSASPVEKPVSHFEKATGGKIPAHQEGGNDSSPPPFDSSAVLEELGLYWLNGSPSYFLRKEVEGCARFLEMGASEVRRKLRVRGVRNRPDPDSGESVSQVDRVLDATTETRAVDFAVSIGGTPAGVYDLPGGRVLVRESPRLIEPKEGDFTNIENFLTALLGDDVMLFCCWLKIGYQALRAGQRRPGQALIIVGPPDCGKSRIQHQIITPILAGRSADPKSFFFGRTDFNAELIGSEHLLVEEVPSSSRHEERLFFGERIKEIVANDTARLHKKNRDAVTVSPFWRLSITLNDNPEKLRCLPPLTDDLAEKIIMLQAKQAPEFWLRFADDPDPRKAFRDSVNRELPAFVHWLETMTIPENLQARRYGVKSHIPEEIGLTIFEGEPEHHLLLLLDKGLWPADEPRQTWRGDAEDLKQALCSDNSSVKGSATRLIGGMQLATVGIWLSHLASKFPSRVVKHRTAEKREWVIHPPAA